MILSMPDKPGAASEETVARIEYGKVDIVQLQNPSFRMDQQLTFFEIWPSPRKVCLRDVPCGLRSRHHSAGDRPKEKVATIYVVVVERCPLGFRPSGEDELGEAVTCY